jgi:putative ABC transport system permease protein
VLAWDLFEREYGADPHLIDGAISVNGRPARIAGVLPASFRLQLPMWWVKDNPQPVEAFVSLPPSRERMAQSGQMFALLKPGIRPEQAETELVALHQRLLEQGGRRALMTGLHVQSLQEKLAGNSGRTLAILMAAGILVLLIACVNVTSLLLARSTARSREVAIRSAIGAARLRVFRQLLVENLLLTLCGGVAGLLLARWSIAALVRISPFAIPRLSETTIDARVAAFALALCVLAAILFGGVSAVSCWRADLQGALKENVRAGGGLLGPRTRRFLMATELALAIVLLTAAGLMWKSFVRMNQHPAGFDPERIVTMRVRLAGPLYQSDAENDVHVREILRTVESEPTLQPAGISSWVLYANAPEFPIRPGLAVTQVIRVNATSPGYLRALGMRLVRGRWLGDNDSGVLLNESLARKIFGDADAIGKQVAIPRPVTVVGVVTDLKYERLDEAVAPEAYVAWQRIPPRFNLSIAARATGDPATLARALARHIADLDRSQPVFAVQTMEQSLSDALAPRRFNLFLLGAFAVVALALALVGIYGVMAYSVTERTREIGVRIALGARRGQVIGMVASEAAMVSAAGIVAGLLIALPFTRLLSTLLYGVGPNDPVVFVGVTFALGLTAVCACIGPAVRASATDPSIALRYE